MDVALQRTERRLGRRFASAAVLCLGLLVAAYSESFRNAFHFDDTHVLENNLYVRSLSNTPRFFTDARTFSALPQNQTYRPLVTLSLAIDYRIAGGLSPAVFHADQLLQLALLGLALWAFFRHLFDEAAPAPSNAYLALFAATFFCLHTVNTETMNLMHARSEVLSALGLVTGFLVYLRWPRLRTSLVYLVPVALGALAKTPAVLFAPLLLLWELLRPAEGEGPAPAWRARWRRAVKASLPAFVAGAVLFWFVEHVMAPPTQTYGGGGRLLYAQTQAWVWLHYLRLFLLPTGLTADTDLRLIDAWYDTRVLAGVAAIAGLAWIAWRSARKRESWPVSFGLCWFAVALLPTSSILPLAEPMNEHRVFLPFVGLTLAAAWGARLLLPGLVSRPALAAGIAAAILTAHAGGTFLRNRVWRSGETLWADVTAKSPANGRAWMNYGVALMSRGQLAAARDCYAKAASFTPAYWTLEVNRGIVEASLGNPEKAEAHFRRAIELDPGQPDVHFYFGRWLSQVGRSPEAIERLKAALRLSPAAIEPRALLADLLAAKGDAGGAADLAREIVASEPGNARARALAEGRSPVQLGTTDRVAYLNRGLALGKSGDFVQSALAYRAALALDPGYADALNNLGWTLGQLGFHPEAVPILERAVALRPDFVLARNNLSMARSGASAATGSTPGGSSPLGRAEILIRQGKAPGALRLLADAAQRTPADLPSLRLLMDLQAARGDRTGAAESAKQILRAAPRDANALAWASGRFPAFEATGYKALFELGVSLGSAKRFVESAIVYRAALVADPASADALNNLGWTLGELGFLEEARSALQKALALSPGFDRARNNLKVVESRGP